MRGVFAAVVGALVFTSAVIAEPPVRDDEAGWFQCFIMTEPREGAGAGQIVFQLWLPEPGDSRPAYLRNGSEYVEVEHVLEDAALTIVFPHYDAFIRAESTISKSGRTSFSGVYSKQRSNGEHQMKFMASEVDSVPPFPSAEKLKSEIDQLEVETWEIEFEKSGAAIGRFVLTGHEWESKSYATREKRDEDVWIFANEALVGTILTPTGDYRYLVGLRSTREGYEEFQSYAFSVFDGAHAFSFGITYDTVSEAFTEGHFFSGNHWHETFTARRLAEGEEYELPDPFSEVSLKPGVTRLGISKLNEPPYAGKPTIVQVFGTWCPNCHDEAPVLADLYERYRDEGLQILSLAYEYTDDVERSERQIARFKERHGATWEFVAAGVNDKTKTAATLPALSTIKSYPTTIWINPDGTVRAIHSGFSGPATGEAYEETLREFEELTKAIVGAR